ncbi:MAG: polysaccharide pyruvyl transferase family protein [Aeromicrobium erythreum]
MSTPSRVVVRSYLDPLEPADITTAPKWLGKNSGNLVFSASAQRLVSAPGVQVEPLPMWNLVREVERINDEGTPVVLPLANAFRRDFLPQLRDLTAFVERLTVPLTILGVGAQGSADYALQPDDAVDEATRRFVRAVLERGPSIGVRGQFTADYLASLGFTETRVIGCPSMFLHGPDLTVREERPPLRWDSPIAVNLTPDVPVPTGWLRDIAAYYRRAVYVPQDANDLRVMLGGAALAGPDDDYPGHLAHPFLAEDRTRFYLHAPTWIEAMRAQAFVFGHRIHGNVAALLAGTPAHVVAHDSRTRELADYFEIPCTLARDVTPGTTVEELYTGSDWGPVVRGHRGRTERIAAYLDEHGLAHTAMTPSGEAPFDQALAALDLWGPEVVVTVRSQDPRVLDARAWHGTTVLQRRVDELERRVAELESRLAERPGPLRRLTGR